MIKDAPQPDYAIARDGLWLGPIIRAHTDVNGDKQRMVLRNVRTYLSAEMIDLTRSNAAQWPSNLTLSQMAGLETT